MKRRSVRETKEMEHRENVQEITRNFRLEMKIVKNTPRSFYSREGGMKKPVAH